jgi:hypothetical protein
MARRRSKSSLMAWSLAVSCCSQPRRSSYPWMWTIAPGHEETARPPTGTRQRLKLLRRHSLRAGTGSGETQNNPTSVIAGGIGNGSARRIPILIINGVSFAAPPPGRWPVALEFTPLSVVVPALGAPVVAPPVVPAPPKCPPVLSNAPPFVCNTSSAGAWPCSRR